MSITRERVIECLDYDPHTGVLRWKVQSARPLSVGAVAGWIDNKGYRRIMLGGRSYKASRLGFLIGYGRWPTPQVDHINGVRDDERIANLREVSNRQNNQNRAVHRDGKLCGATLYRARYLAKPWMARIRVDGKRKLLGYFATEQDAHEAYVAACEGL